MQPDSSKFLADGSFSSKLLTALPLLPVKWELQLLLSIRLLMERLREYGKLCPPLSKTLSWFILHGSTVKIQMISNMCSLPERISHRDCGSESSLIVYAFPKVTVVSIYSKQTGTTLDVLAILEKCFAVRKSIYIKVLTLPCIIILCNKDISWIKYF